MKEKKCGTGFSVTRNEKGFTLIELIIVIVILGILAVVAIPKYQDIRDEAAGAAATGVYGAAQAATAVNFAANLAGKNIDMILGADELAAAMEGGVPDGWTSSGTGINTTLTTVVNNRTYTIEVTGIETTSIKAVLSFDSSG